MHTKAVSPEEDSEPGRGSEGYLSKTWRVPFRGRRPVGRRFEKLLLAGGEDKRIPLSVHGKEGGNADLKEMAEILSGALDQVVGRSLESHGCGRPFDLEQAIEGFNKRY